MEFYDTNEAQRESTRIPVQAKARIRINGGLIEGEVENLSMNGAYVRSDEHFKINSSVVITILDDSITSRTIFDIEAKVIWNMNNGLGLQFA